MTSNLGDWSEFVSILVDYVAVGEKAPNKDEALLKMAANDARACESGDVKRMIEDLKTSLSEDVPIVRQVIEVLEGALALKEIYGKA